MEPIRLAFGRPGPNPRRPGRSRSFHRKRIHPRQQFASEIRPSSQRSWNARSVTIVEGSATFTSSTVIGSSRLTGRRTTASSRVRWAAGARRARFHTGRSDCKTRSLRSVEDVAGFEVLLGHANTSETSRSRGTMLERRRIASMAHVSGTSMLHRWNGRNSVYVGPSPCRGTRAPAGAADGPWSPRETRPGGFHRFRSPPRRNG